MTRSDFVASVRNPRSIAVTNNLDTNEGDRLVIVPEFFGDPQADGESKNNGRKGRVHLYGSTAQTRGVIGLDPFTNTGAGLRPAPRPISSTRWRSPMVASTCPRSRLRGPAAELEEQRLSRGLRR